MDMVKLLNEAIGRLPGGDHSAGLTAIMRHIGSAIRHFERDPTDEPDAFTDAIYRTNQAYEGSLKEAYRVLAGKDPSGLSPHEIEKYLETNRVVRPRVLTQLIRYRHDYRNPSTHDYKLDFDEDEALLAIVSVSAFAKLLIDQISERLAYERAIAEGRPVKAPTFKSAEDFYLYVARFALEFTRSRPSDITYSEFEGELAGSLTAAGLSAMASVLSESGDLDGWDVLVTHSTYRLAIEVRIASARLSTQGTYAVEWILGNMDQDNVGGGLVILTSKSRRPYNLWYGRVDNKPIYLITHYDGEQLKKLGRGLGSLEVDTESMPESPINGR